MLRRRNNLSWSHHREVAALEPADQDRWLDRATARLGELLAGIPDKKATSGSGRRFLPEGITHKASHYAQAIAANPKALETSDYEYHTLARATWVAARIESYRRRQLLTWSHHLEVAALEPADQDRPGRARTDDHTGVIDETVRAAKKFLEEHPEERKKILIHGKESIVGSPLISLFLGWNQNRVAYSLERLGLIDEGVVEAEAVRALPTGRARTDDHAGGISRRSGPMDPFREFRRISQKRPALACPRTNERQLPRHIVDGGIRGPRARAGSRPTTSARASIIDDHDVDQDPETTTIGAVITTAGIEAHPRAGQKRRWPKKS